MQSNMFLLNLKIISNHFNERGWGSLQNVGLKMSNKRPIKLLRWIGEMDIAQKKTESLILNCLAHACKVFLFWTESNANTRCKPTGNQAQKRNFIWNSLCLKFAFCAESLALTDTPRSRIHFKNKTSPKRTNGYSTLQQATITLRGEVETNYKYQKSYSWQTTAPSMPQCYLAVNPLFRSTSIKQTCTVHVLAHLTPCILLTVIMWNLSF